MSIASKAEELKTERRIKEEREAAEERQRAAERRRSIDELKDAVAASLAELNGKYGLVISTFEDGNFGWIAELKRVHPVSGVTLTLFVRVSGHWYNWRGSDDTAEVECFEPRASLVSYRNADRAIVSSHSIEGFESGMASWIANNFPV